MPRRQHPADGGSKRPDFGRERDDGRDMRPIPQPFTRCTSKTNARSERRRRPSPHEPTASSSPVKQTRAAGSPRTCRGAIARLWNTKMAATSCSASGRTIEGPRTAPKRRNTIPYEEARRECVERARQIMKKDEVFLSQAARSSDFTFDETVADVFDDMVGRSVPFYAEQQRMICEIARTFWYARNACV